MDGSFVDVLASGVHDTKNALFDALGRIESVRRALAASPATDTEHDKALTEAAAAIETSANRLAKILSAYRLVRRENPVVLLPTPLADFAEYVRLRAAESWQGSATLEVGPVANAVWLLDRELIADSLVNALGNAARHAKCKVDLDFRIESDMLHITVGDDGDGYPEGILSGHVPLTSAGLFIARKLAGQHERNGRRGRLTLSNRDGGGAVFELRLP